MYVQKQNTNLSVLSGYITARRERVREICRSCPGLLDGGGRGANTMKEHQMREIRESENQQSQSKADLWPCTWRRGQRSLLLCPSCHLSLTTPSCFTCTVSVSYSPLFLPSLFIFSHNLTWGRSVPIENIQSRGARLCKFCWAMFSSQGVKATGVSQIHTKCSLAVGLWV